MMSNHLTTTSKKHDELKRILKPLLSIKNSGKNNPRYGKRTTNTEETRRKISESRKGKKNSEESKRKQSATNTGEGNPNYGNRWNQTEEAKRKISEAVRGENHPLYGKPCSEERKRNISIANTGSRWYVNMNTGERFQIKQEEFDAREDKEFLVPGSGRKGLHNRINFLTGDIIMFPKDEGYVYPWKKYNPRIERKGCVLYKNPQTSEEFRCRVGDQPDGFFAYCELWGYETDIT